MIFSSVLQPNEDAAIPSDPTNFPIESCPHPLASSPSLSYPDSRGGLIQTKSIKIFPTPPAVLPLQDTLAQFAATKISDLQFLSETYTSKSPPTPLLGSTVPVGETLFAPDMSLSITSPIPSSSSSSSLSCVERPTRRPLLVQVSRSHRAPLSSVVRYQEPLLGANFKTLQV